MWLGRVRLQKEKLTDLHLALWLGRKGMRRLNVLLELIQGFKGFPDLINKIYTRLAEIIRIRVTSQAIPIYFL